VIESRRSNLTTVRTRCAGALYCLNLSWFSAFNFIENVFNTLVIENILRYMCANYIKIELGFTKLLQKYNGAVFFDSHGRILAPAQHIINIIINDRK